MTATINFLTIYIERRKVRIWPKRVGQVETADVFHRCAKKLPMNYIAKWNQTNQLSTCYLEKSLFFYKNPIHHYSSFIFRRILNSLTLVIWAIIEDLIFLWDCIFAFIILVKLIRIMNGITSWKVSISEVFFGPYFLAFGLNTERYSVSLRIPSKCEKIRTRETLNTDTFCAGNFGYRGSTGCIQWRRKT